MIRPQAAFEMNAAFDWYEQQRAGLGYEFLRALDAALAALAREPLLRREVRPGVRRALLRRFPYGVFFGVSETAVIVLAVLHHRRTPHRWPRRAGG
ncbi:MAG: type II toxin-antitoxin system RelE/ParE family toxin [Gemmatimonadaceae bacterium]|nr:type II toxin-antitoxin system RelE/ParE family toxin [Gemmatimonadaceae bacterium]